MAYIPVINNARLGANAVDSSKVQDGTITDADVATANKDGVAGTPSLRTIGTGAQQAMAGNTRLDTIAAPTGPVSFNSQRATNVATPVAGTDGANKDYVDAMSAGLDPKESVLYTTTGDITLSGLATQGDGTWPGTLTAGDRILVWQQADASENGIYEAAAGAWVRATDFDGTPSNEVSTGAYTLVAAADGTDYVGTGFVVISPDPIVVGTDDIEWTPFSAPGAVIALDDLTDVSTAGTAAGSVLYDVGGGNWQPSDAVFLNNPNQSIDFIDDSSVQGNGGDLNLTPGTAGSGRVNVAGPAIFAAGQRVNVQVVAGDHTVDLDADYIVILNTAAALRTATLPDDHEAGDQVVVKRSGVNAAAVTSTDNIDGLGTDFVLDVDLMAVTFVSDGTDWWVF